MVGVGAGGAGGLGRAGRRGVEGGVVEDGDRGPGGEGGVVPLGGRGRHVHLHHHTSHTTEQQRDFNHQLIGLKQPILVKV